MYGPFFFIEMTANGSIHLDVPQSWLFPQLADDSTGFVYQQDGTPPDWSHGNVRAYLNDELPYPELAVLAVMTRSPDLTPCSFGDALRTLPVYAHYQKR